MSTFSAHAYRAVFALAAVYNIVFGLWAGLFPRAFFELFDLPAPRYPAIWACLGMVVGLYGAGYAYAAKHIDRAYPFIAIGFAGKILGPIGWLLAVGSAELPFRTFPLIVFNDLVWWLPFALFLIEGTSAARLIKRSSPYVCAVLHAIAGIGTVLLLRGGSEAIADPLQRATYVIHHLDWWRAGWVLWMLAAVSLIGFYAWWASRIANPRVALLALFIAAVGLICDFLGESLLIAWLPRSFDAISRTASLLMAGAANGFYTIAGIILTLLTPRLGGWERIWTWTVWGAGVALSFAAFTRVEISIVVASALLMILLIPWLVIVAPRIR